MTLFGKLFDPTTKLLLLGCIFSLLMHIPFMDMPPRGNHVWRQCNTLSVARNFYEEEMNILKPRIDRRESTDGITGMQFPSFEFIIASVYKVTGEQNWVHRTVQFFLFVLGVVGFFKLTHVLTGNEVLAVIAAWFFIWSPELFYYSINALPDILALTFSLWGLYWFLKFLSQNDNSYLILSWLALILAGATKLQYLAVGGAMLLGLLLQFRHLSAKQIVIIGLFGISILAITGSWYLYAEHLTQASGLNDFGLAIKEFPSAEEALVILRSIFQVKIPETLMGYAATIAFIIGVVSALRKSVWKKQRSIILSGWSAVLLLYFILELGQFKYHSYYMIPFIPPLCIAGGYGALQVYNSRFNWVYLALIVASPILTGFRIVPGLLKKPNVPVGLYDESKCTDLQNHIPENALVVAGNDPTSGVYLYYLRAKGWAFSHFKPLNQIDEKTGKHLIKNYINNGASILITDTPVELLGIDEHTDSLVYTANGFWIYSLKDDR